jgi:hypothetical protein
MLGIDVAYRMFQIYLSGLLFECLQCNLDVPSHIKNALDIIVEVFLKPPARLLTAATILAAQRPSTEYLPGPVTASSNNPPMMLMFL